MNDGYDQSGSHAGSVFPALMAFAAASDLLTMTISNRVSLALLAGFGLMAALIGMSLNDIGLHFAAATLVLAVAFGCFAFGWIGGGDAKLTAAIALWLGFAHLIEFLLAASIFGGVLTLLIIGFRRFRYRPIWPAMPGSSGCIIRQPACPTASRSRSQRSSSISIPCG